MRKKILKIEKVIDNCLQCIYCEYDSYYSMSQDAGYDCNFTGKRIMDEYDFVRTKEGLPIPDWCPLEDIKEKEAFKC